MVTYQDSSGTTNTNPIILDSNGSCQVWLTDGQAYKYFLATPTDSDPPTGTNFFPVDNISSPAGAMSALSVNSITTNASVSTGQNNSVVLANATSGAITVTLPSAIAAGAAFIVTIKKTDSSGNAVTISPVLAQTIDGASSVALSSQWQVYQLVSDGANWQTVIVPISPTAFAPSSATYITQTPNGTLTNEQALSTLSSGLMHSTTTTGVVATIADSATAGTLLQSGGAGVTPSYTTATYPTSTTVNQLLYSSSNNIIGGLSTAASSVLSTSAGSVPSFSSTLPNVNIGTPTGGTLTNCTLPVGGVTGLGTGVATWLASPTSAHLASAVATSSTGSGSLVFSISPSLTTPVLGTPSSGNLSSCTNYPSSSLSGTVPLSLGGTNAALSASNGGIFYSTSTGGAILAGTATAAQMLLSGASAAPSWSTATIPSTAGTSGTLLSSNGTNWVNTAFTMAVASGNTNKLLQSNGTNWVASGATFPTTFTANNLLYASSTTALSGLATANSAALVTTSAGVPVMSSTMTNGQVIIGSTSATPTAATLTAGTGVSITNGAGSITVAQSLTLPKFKAQFSAGGGTMSTGAFTVIPFNSATFDTSSYYSTSTYKYTPLIAGYYQINVAFCAATSAATEQYIALIYKNGSVYSGAGFYTTAASLTGSSADLSDIVYCNGSTDYIQAYYYISNGTNTFHTTTAYSWFSGHLVG